MGENGEYAVGYKKPPLHTRFRAGRSGNPRGRPRASKTLAELLGDVLGQKVAVAGERGGRRATKREIIVTNLVDRATKADMPALRLLLDLLRRFDTSPDDGAAKTEAAREELARLFDRLAAEHVRQTAEDW